MSESAAREERERIRKEQERLILEKQQEKIQLIIKDIRTNFEGVKALLPDTNPAAWKALLFLRKKLRALRHGWREQVFDVKTSQSERDALIGQVNAVLLIFDLITQFRDMNKKLIPGKEEEIILSMMRRPQPSGRPQQ
jgi:hypothetical protein